jgi:RimJ/RimL family protein N-acetyltransferase
MAADPGSARWIAQAAVAEPEGIVAGYAGFHGPPGEAGMVEVGHTVVPEFRGQGYARAMLAELLRRAAAEPAVRIVRTTIRPGNAASLATIAGFSLAGAGEQWDGEDGLELIFEIPAGHGPEQPAPRDGRQPACGGRRPDGLRRLPASVLALPELSALPATLAA